MTSKDVYLDVTMRGWIAKTAHKERWRMAHWYSYEDLKQDGYLCYAKCWNKYRDIFDVPEPTDEQRRWFMSLVQRAYYNYIMTLASHFARAPKEGIFPQVENDDTTLGMESLLPGVMPDAPLICALMKLPKELTEVLDKILKDGIDTGVYLRKRIRGSRVTVRETTAEYWERVLGRPGVPEQLADLIR
jgi:hypothetical protein